MNIFWMVAFFTVGWFLGHSQEPEVKKPSQHSFVLKSGNSVDCDYFAMDGMICLRCESSRDTFSVTCDWFNPPKSNE